MEGVVEDGPDLLSEGGEVGVAHPVKVDEEDEVDCCRGSCDDADDEGVCVFGEKVCWYRLYEGWVNRQLGHLLQASGLLTMVTTF